MSNSTPGAFHCPSCGKLSLPGEGEAGALVCSGCGYEFRRPIRVAPRSMVGRIDTAGRFVQRDVVSRRRIDVREQVVVPVEAAVQTEGAERGSDGRRREEVVLEDGTRRVLKRRRRRPGVTQRHLRLVVVCLVVLLVCVAGVRKVMKMARRPVSENARLKEERIEAAKSAEVQAFIDKSLPECETVLQGFMMAGDTSERAQFVHDPTAVTPYMAAYYQSNLPRRPTGALSFVASGLRMMGEVPVIETRWMSEDGEPLEVSFVRGGQGKWAIDWEEYERFATVPWFRFREGLGERSGEFRLYVRERQRTLGEEGVMTVQFYPPLEDVTLRARGESPRIPVSLESKNGRRLLALMASEAADAGKGGTMYGEWDPEGMWRVRVELAWKPGAGGEDFMILKEIHAADWFGTGLEREPWTEELVPPPVEGEAEGEAEAEPEGEGGAGGADETVDPE